MHELSGIHYLDLNEAARRLNLSPRTLESQRQHGRERVRSTVILGRVLYLASEVDAAVAAGAR